MPCIEARGLRKTFGSTIALDGIDLDVEAGHILGIVGPNGAGKSTALHALLGLVACEGSLRVLGRDPRAERDRLMLDVAFIADVAVLPRWIRVGQMLDYVSGVHPRFDRGKAEGFVSRCGIRNTDQVRRLSKGTVTQLHLAIVMAIDAKLLVLDEPTLGLDPLARKQFYDALLNDYFDHTRTILVTTHQIDEIQDVLTDFVFLDAGRIVLASSMEAFESRYSQVRVERDRLKEAQELRPIHERCVLGRSILLFEDADPRRLASLGDVRRPTLDDLFVAVMEGKRTLEARR
jgi:ABC-2 type transport system ATP-binding protein